MSEALAIRQDRILAAGTNSEIRRLAGKSTRFVDLQGRTVVPGLIDSHMHAIRAALSFSTEVNWIGTKSVAEALARLRGAAKTRSSGDWLIVAGGWTPEQFAEKRAPTQAELAEAGGEHPIYIQLFYRWAMLTPKALEQLGIKEDKDVPPAGKLDRDTSGNLTGGITGNTPTITGLFARLPKPSFAEQIEGTKAFFKELNRLGLTGVIDPGGFGMAPPDYQALFTIWKDGDLSVRVAYTIFAQGRGKELEDYKNLTQLLPMGFGDEWLRFNGIGEKVGWGGANNAKPTRP